MKNTFLYPAAMGMLLLQLLACTPNNSSSGLKDALTLYVSFDQGTVADFAKGDKNMYTVSSRKKLNEAKAGLHSADHKIVEGAGRWGSALSFDKKSKTSVFYKSKDNIAYDPTNWSGTLSFWLSVSPATDLAPGFTDPIQITDKRYDDASIWVDFTKENPRDFRLGVFGDKAVWTKDTLSAPVDSVQEKRYVRVKQPPFSKDSWTHVLITYDGLGTSNSQASLYLDSEKMGTISGIADPFTWAIEESKIYLGLSFVGLMDELSIYDKPLTAQQIKTLYQLEGGVKSVL